MSRLRRGWERVRAWRWPGLVSRILAAAVGGYALGALVCVACALLLPLSRAEATLVGMMLSFVAYAGAVVWVFAARSSWRAWAGVVLPSLILAAVSWMGKGA